MAKPKLLLIPAAQGDKFYSVLPSSGVGDFDFTRSGGATRINSQGLIETVADGVSRLNYPLIDGKVVGCPSHLLEPQSTNAINYSEDFSNSAWSKSNSTITNDNAISPNGTLNADKLVENAVSSTHWIREVVSVSNGKVTFSIFAKKGERNFLVIRENTLGGKFFDLSNGTINSDFNATLVDDAKIESYGNGWYKCSITVTVSTSSADFLIYVTNEDGVTNYQGDGTSGIYIWGAMVEQGSFPTSYIPTNGSQTTRSAETANGSSDASTFNDSEGVLMAEGSLLDVSQNFNKISISDGSSAENRIEFIYLNDNEIKIELGLTNGFNEVLNVGSSESFNKIAVVYNSTNASVFINGFNLVTNTMSSLNGLSQLQFNRFNSNIENFHGSTKQIQYFDSALNDSDLETLTSWVSFTDMAEGQLYTIE